MRAAFPRLNRWLEGLPDPREPRMCVYSGAHVWWHIIATFLCRRGSRNGYDQQRQAGEAAGNFGALCGQGPEDPRFEGEPRVTCSDNAARHAARVAPEPVARIPELMFRSLLRRRLFDRARLLDRWYLVLLDGTVKEKCRRGFREGGKSSTGAARYRYVLQASVIGPEDTLLPLIHEEMDVDNPATQKEDCELESFRRLSRRLKELFPGLSVCLVGDALYACRSVVATCREFGWKYILTLKEGRQPTTWQETVKLLPLHRENRLRLHLGKDGKEGIQDFRWVEDVLLGKRIALLRRRRKLGQRAAAKLAGISQPTLVALEKRSSGTLRALDSVLTVLGAGPCLVPEGEAPGFYSHAALSSGDQSWQTPTWLLERLYSVFGRFDLDPCSPGKSRSAPVRARVRFTEADDALALPWFGTVFLNPPYSRKLPAWTQKAGTEVESGNAAPIVGLLPARTDTRWWHRDIVDHAAVLFLKGRLSFGKGGQSAPFPSALVVWGSSTHTLEQIRELFPEAQFVAPPDSPE